MRRTIVITLALFVLLLAGCQGDESDETATPGPAAPTQAPTEAPTEEAVAAPTEVPPAEPTEEPSETVVEADLANLSALVAHPWQWVSFTNPATSS